MRTVTGRARLISRIEVEARAFANADYTTRDLSYGRASWGCSTQARSSATGRELQRPELATGSPTGHPEDGPPDAQATLTPAADLFAARERAKYLRESNEENTRVGVVPTWSFTVLHLAERANLGLAWEQENHGFCNEARERPGGAGRAAATPKPNLSSRPCLSGQGVQHAALCLQPDGHMRDPRGTAAFPPTLRLGTRGEGRTEASDGGAGRAPGVDPRSRGKHQHPLAPTRSRDPNADVAVAEGERGVGAGWP